MRIGYCNGHLDSGLGPRPRPAFAGLGSLRALQRPSCLAFWTCTWGMASTCCAQGMRRQRHHAVFACTKSKETEEGAMMQVLFHHHHHHHLLLLLPPMSSTTRPVAPLLLFRIFCTKAYAKSAIGGTAALPTMRRTLHYRHRRAAAAVRLTTMLVSCGAPSVTTCCRFRARFLQRW